MSEEILLGGNIQLSGFREVDRASMIILKKIIGNYVRRISSATDTTSVKLHLKPIHKTEEKSKKFEIHGMVDSNGKTYTSEVIENNIFTGVDSCLKKITGELGIK